MCSGTSVLRSFFYTLLAGALLVFAGCSSSALGYGVVLLSPDQHPVQTGTVVKVLEESSLNNSYKIEAPGSQNSYSIDTWRVKLFQGIEQAEEWASSYSEYAQLYARNLRDGLAIREEPDIKAPRVYKLRLDQEIKILEKTGVEDEIGGHTGHWYRVLTRDGVKGYCFDLYLDVFDISAGPEEERGPDLSELAEAFTRAYRPVVFQDMLRNGRIRFDQFSERYGLFPDPEAKTLTMRLFEKTYLFEYSSVKKTGPSRYLLLPTNLEVILRSENVIQTVFTEDDITYDPVFVYVEEETIQKVREEEMKRREELFQRLLEHGPEFAGSAYGSITFKEGNGFVWTNLDRLVPGIIPDENFREGEITFDFFLGNQLQGDYDGVMALRFSKAPSKPIFFLYVLEENSLKLEYLPDRNIEERVARSRSSSPLIMAFFSH